jgi:hypothetical protein
MPLQPEVDTLERQIGGDEYLLILVFFVLATAGRELQHGTVVPNSGTNGRIFSMRRDAAKLGNQCFFGNRHGNQYKWTGTLI